MPRKAGIRCSGALNTTVSRGSGRRKPFAARHGRAGGGFPLDCRRRARQGALAASDTRPARMPLTPELIAILGVGAALAGIVLKGQQSLVARMDRLEARMDGFVAEMRAIRDQLSRLEGKMDFLEAYIVGRNERPAGPAE